MAPATFPDVSADFRPSDAATIARAAPTDNAAVVQNALVLDARTANRCLLVAGMSLHIQSPGDITLTSLKIAVDPSARPSRTESARAETFALARTARPRPRTLAEPGRCVAMAVRIIPAYILIFRSRFSLHLKARSLAAPRLQLIEP